MIWLDGIFTFSIEDSQTTVLKPGGGSHIKWTGVLDVSFLMVN